MHWVLFDWGDTLMRTLDHPGPMCSWPRVDVVPGALALLSSLHGKVGIALATNAADSQEEEIRRALVRGGLSPFVDRIFCFRSVGSRKASPCFFAHIVAQLEVPASRLVMVGDDFEQDVTAAGTAGIKAVWFNERNHESRIGAEVQTIHALTELPQVLEAWGVLAAGTP